MGGAIAKSVLEEENARLAEETAEMKRQLESRKVVERAKGILQRRYSLTEEDAYLRLRNESRRLRRPMKDLAEAIILSEELSRKYGQVCPSKSSGWCENCTTRSLTARNIPAPELRAPCASPAHKRGGQCAVLTHTRARAGHSPAHPVHLC